MAWRNQDISVDDAKAIVAKDRYTEKLVWSRGFCFSATKINEILAQESCIGIRIYLGKDIDEATGEYVDAVVIVGVQGTAEDPPASCDDMHTGLMAEYGYSTHESPAVRDNSGSPLARD
jgi:hypothetical protein